MKRIKLLLSHIKLFNLSVYTYARNTLIAIFCNMLYHLVKLASNATNNLLFLNMCFYIVSPVCSFRWPSHTYTKLTTLKIHQQQQNKKRGRATSYRLQSVAIEERGKTFWQIKVQLLSPLQPPPWLNPERSGLDKFLRSLTNASQPVVKQTQEVRKQLRETVLRV